MKIYSTKYRGHRLVWFFSGKNYYVLVDDLKRPPRTFNHFEVGCGKTQIAALNDLRSLKPL